MIVVCYSRDMIIIGYNGNTNIVCNNKDIKVTRYKPVTKIQFLSAI